jgi:hypothetical protein
MNMKTGLFIAMILSLSFPISCATPKIDMASVWKDKAYQGKYFRKVLVIGDPQKQKVRRMFEEEVVVQLKDRGTDAIASYTIIPFDKLLDKATVKEKLKGLGIDSILVTELVFKTTEEDHSPPPPNWNEYYTQSFGYGRGIFANRTEGGTVFARLQTKLFDARTEEPVWSASSSVLAVVKPYKEIKSFVRTLIEKLAEERLVK